MSRAAWPALAQDKLASVFSRLWEGKVEYNWILPLSSRYGTRTDPHTGAIKHHDGIDIPLPIGTPVIAVYDGIVARVDTAGTREDGTVKPNGNAVFLEAGPWRFCYLHLDSFCVTKGQRVQRGEKLGEVGTTGKSTGPHLHFQVYFGGKVIDPMILYPGNLFKER
jgi:murein DD-endopeptidase MepM/ murein hydrolase activator NlpD